MNITNKCFLAGAAVVLVLVQHAVHLSAFAFFGESMPQSIWLLLNAAQAVVMLSAWWRLHGVHRGAATVIGSIAVILLIAILFENFITPLGDLFWVSNSVLLILGLILSAIYLLKSDARFG